MKRRYALLVCCSLLGGSAPAQLRPLDVDLELILAVDVSYSMEIDEQQVQRRGYVNAFLQPTLVGAIQSGSLGRIAATYVEWGGSAVQIVPWTLIDGPDSAARFAEELRRHPLRRLPFTSISNTLAFSRKLFQISPFQGTRRVIDISGDGPNNAGVPAPVARNSTVAQGIVIDGLPIILMHPGSDSASIPDLDTYYEKCVIGGAGAFLLKVKDLGDFADAILKKLVIEVVGPEVSSLERYELSPRWVADRGDYNCFVGEEMQERRIAQ